ncbi:MAG TPA: DUF881 domain-containing protein [Actinoplanes sp.]|nr:DUF881 domain-containing protein [Actinoplanes sp.]
MAFSEGGASWKLVFRRVARGLRPPHDRRRSVWSVGVPLIALAAGLLFTTSATTADGTTLREDRRPQLTQLIAEKRKRLAASEHEAADLLTEVDRETGRLAELDQPAQNQANALRLSAGFSKLTGPGVTVTLNDSPRRGSDFVDNAPDNDDLVVHQGDVQAVVNALWAGGAEAMTIMDVRVISTSAVRCVGNTLLLHGQVFSPPFKITAIGEPTAMHRALESAEGVRQFREAVTDFGLGYTEKVEKNVTVQAYDGSTDLRSAQAAQ